MPIKTSKRCHRKYCQDLLLLHEAQGQARRIPGTPSLLIAAASETLLCNLVSVFKKILLNGYHMVEN